MNKKFMITVTRDRHGFLEEYIKSLLPNIYYRRTIKKKIKGTKNILDYKMPSGFKKESVDFWKSKLGKKISLHWHRAYAATNGIEDPRYISEDIFYSIIEQKLNRYELAKAYQDKNNYDHLFKNIEMPVTVIRNINGNFYDKEYKQISINKAKKLINDSIYDNKLVCKPSIDSGGGRNIEIISSINKTVDSTELMIDDIFRRFDKDYIIQEYVEQNSVLMNMHNESLNTIRIISLRLNNTIHYLSGIVRMGNNGSFVDNATVGGLTCGINREGKLNSFDTDHYAYNKYLTHPYSKFVFEGATIPNMGIILNFINKLHSKLLYFDIVSWDIAINKIGNPVLIEVNLKMQDINFHQRNNGPLFGDLTDETLEKCFEEQK